MTIDKQAHQGFTQSGSPLEVLLAFGKLGVTFFGGPIAHIGYFREEFVVRRRWVDEHTYADLVALCQFQLDEKSDFISEFSPPKTRPRIRFK